MQFLVIGCTGMAGHVISLYLKEKGHGVTGISRRPQSLVDGVTGDLTEPGFVREIVASRHFDIVMNCAGILNREAELYYFYFTKDTDKKMIILEPSEEMVENIRKYLPNGAWRE